MDYRVFGPYEMKRHGGIVSRENKHKKAFWRSVGEDEEGLPDACGCYALVIRNKSWYIGLAEKQSFRSECLQAHKIMQYDAALNEVAGVPYLIFLARMTPSGRFSSPSGNGYPDVRLLEKLLIGAAIDRNSKLMNVRDTKILRHMNVPGFLNTKKGQANADSVQELKKAIGV